MALAECDKPALGLACVCACEVVLVFAVDCAFAVELSTFPVEVNVPPFSKLEVPVVVVGRFAGKTGSRSVGVI